MLLRPVRSHEDARHLYNWRTDAHTEAMSLTPGPATYQEHLAWLNRVLADTKTKLFIAEIGGDPVGTGRLTIAGKEAEVSVTVAPAMRGRGYGTEIIACLVSEAKALGLTRLHARVKGTNVASLLAFIETKFAPDAAVIRLERPL